MRFVTGSAELWRSRPRWFLPGLLVALVALAVASSCTYGLQRPLTVKEQIYQAGGILLGLGQELEYAARAGLVKGDTLSALILGYDAAQQIYRRAANLAIAGSAAEAAKARSELLQVIDKLRRDLLAAGVKGAGP